jgi:hypothetical protein
MPGDLRLCAVDQDEPVSVLEAETQNSLPFWIENDRPRVRVVKGIWVLAHLDLAGSGGDETLDRGACTADNEWKGANSLPLNV